MGHNMNKKTFSYASYSIVLYCSFFCHALQAPACTEHLCHKRIQHAQHRNKRTCRTNTETRSCKKHARHRTQQAPISIAQPVQDAIIEVPSVAPQAETALPKKQIERSVCVKNGITKKMISYTKCFVSYTPDFHIRINEQELKPGSQETFAIKGDTIAISYDYNFLNGYKKGKKVVEFALPEDTTTFEVTFSWNDDWRVILPSAKPISSNQIY